jgi:UDP-N-acetylmuramoyl-tripeptide--D-alanyl-D-alanine ligase
MAELGDSAREGHEQAGRLAAGLGIDILVAVGGTNAAAVAGVALSHGGPLRAVVVPDADAALAALRDLLRPGDVVLAKASHAMQLEELAVTLATAGGSRA